MEPGEISKVRDLTARGEPAQTNLLQTQEAAVAHGQGVKSSLLDMQCQAQEGISWEAETPGLPREPTAMGIC